MLSKNILFYGTNTRYANSGEKLVNWENWELSPTLSITNWQFCSNLESRWPLLLSVDENRGGVVSETLCNRQYYVWVDGRNRVTLRNRHVLRKIHTVSDHSHHSIQGADYPTLWPSDLQRVKGSNMENRLTTSIPEPLRQDAGNCWRIPLPQRHSEFFTAIDTDYYPFSPYVQHKLNTPSNFIRRNANWW